MISISSNCILLFVKRIIRNYGKFPIKFYSNPRLITSQSTGGLRWEVVTNQRMLINRKYSLFHGTMIQTNLHQLIV